MGVIAIWNPFEYDLGHFMRACAETHAGSTHVVVAHPIAGMRPQTKRLAVRAHGLAQRIIDDQLDGLFSSEHKWMATEALNGLGCAPASAGPRLHRQRLWVVAGIGARRCLREVSPSIWVS